MGRFLLDTNMLLGFARKAPWAKSANVRHKLSDPNSMVVTSVICYGEMLALAEKFGWGAEKRDRLETMLKQLPTIDINHPRILESYARLDTWTHGKVVSSHPWTPPKSAVPMSQNDLWIAATAHATGFTLLSTDTGFAHLNRIWITFIYIAQK